MDPEACTQLYTCSKVKMTPMIRVLLRCTAAEAMQSICKDCEAERAARAGRAKAQVGAKNTHTYRSPSGRKLMVMVGDRSGPENARHD
jgi:hypothetical protein